MPSSTSAIYFENGRLVDFYGRPIDLSLLSTQGPTGPPGEDGQSLLFTSGGTGLVERIRPDSSMTLAATSNSISTATLDLFSYFTRDRQIIKFTSVHKPFNPAGTLNEIAINFLNLSSTGATTTNQLLVLNNTSANEGLLPAKIKYDRLPSSNPTGYSNLEAINYVLADFEITRRSSVSINIQAKVYGHASVNQFGFGNARFTQKIWLIDINHTLNSLCRLEFVVTPDASGVDTLIKNILRYNAY